MENIYPRIKQVSVSIDRNTVYKFDVNQSVSIRKLKKMIISAANLQKSGLRLLHDSIDYSKNDRDTLQDLFPSQKVIEFNVSTDASNEHDENEKHIKLKFGKYCPKHEFKYAYFFCYDCSSSLCSLCLQTENHSGHNYIEKYDYLQSSRNLVETIFYDLKEYSYEGKFNDAKLDEMRFNIKNKIFPSLRELIDRIEKNILDLFDFYYEAESVSFKNLQMNVSELKKHCTEGLDKLKSEIEIEDLIINEKVFLTFDQKFKEIADEKFRISANNEKYENLKSIICTEMSNVQSFCSDITSYLKNHLNLNNYFDTKSKVIENSVTSIPKDDIILRLTSDVKEKLQRPEFAYSSLSPKKLINLFGQNPVITNTPKFNAGYAPRPSPLKDVIMNNLINGQEISDNIIGQVIPETNNIAIYNDSTNEITINSIVLNSFLGIESFLSNCAVLNVNGKLYISGGIQNSAASSCFLVYNNHTGEIKKLPDLLNPRYSHSMYYHEGFIYFVGGSTKATEKFDINEFKFTKLTNINCEERFNPVLYSHENHLYAFFGNNKGNFIDSIEKLNLKSSRNKWENVLWDQNFSNAQILDLKLTGCGIVQGEGSSIYLLGGKTRSGAVNSVIKYDFAKKQFEKIETVLEHSYYFNESKFHCLGKDLFGLFTSDNAEMFFKFKVSN